MGVPGQGREGGEEAQAAGRAAIQPGGADDLKAGGRSEARGLKGPASPRIRKNLYNR